MVKHIVSYSGGLGSAITADLVCKEYGKDNVLLLFADTKVEDEDLYRFNKDVVNLLGCELITISDGRTPWQVFNDEKFIGSSLVDPCSKILKRQLLLRWTRTNYKPDECIVWIGIDVLEEHRLAPVVRNCLPYNYRSILIEKGLMLDSNTKKSWCTDNGIKIPKLYELGFSHNNCGGFCVKAGLGQFKKLYEFLPEVYAENERQEQEAIKNNPNLKPFLRKSIGGIRTYISMKDYREKYLMPNKVTEDEAMEFGGCGCAL